MVTKVAAVASAILLALTFGCSQQQSASQSSGSTQIASAGSGQQCEVDVKRVCQELRKKPVINSLTGLTYDSTEVEQNSFHTALEFSTIQVPNGSVIQVQCEINPRHQSVVYAHLMPGPPLTATDVAYLKNSGYCAP
jgi:hypothetical protein